MYIQSVGINNFRNYKEDTIYLDKKTVIVGANDAGKTNLLYAMRLLLDNSLPESKLVPAPTDFNIYSESSTFSICIKFCEIDEECVLAKLKGNISEEGVLFLKIIGSYDKKSGKRYYNLYIGEAEESLKEIDSRFYLKVLNMKYIESSRDLHKFIKKEKNWLLETTIEERTSEEQSYDEKAIDEINSCLNCISEKVSSLNYIKNSTQKINNNLKKLSAHNSKKEVSFSTKETDSQIMIERLALGVKEDGHSFQLGGDGFSNQTHLSLWAARNEIERLNQEIKTSVTLYCIEEIEAHLHPHQQRRLSKFMNKFFAEDQVILTTHSPQIASHFPPETVVRLLNSDNETKSFSHTANNFLYREDINFGYRMNAISAEIYFADVVILVEGPSETIFYEALAQALDINLDFYNISLIDVSGVGFLNYCDLATTIGTNWVLRTDNDISKVPHKDKARFAGILRGIKIAKVMLSETISKEGLTWDGVKKSIPPACSSSAKQAIEELKNLDIHIANIDLENDLINTPFGEHVKNFFNVETNEQAVSKLQNSKAINMFELMKKKHQYLSMLCEDDICLPLKSAVDIAKGR